MSWWCFRHRMEPTELRDDGKLHCVADRELKCITCDAVDITYIEQVAAAMYEEHRPYLGMGGCTAWNTFRDSKERLHEELVDFWLLMARAAIKVLRPKREIYEVSDDEVEAGVNELLKPVAAYDPNPETWLGLKEKDIIAHMEIGEQVARIIVAAEAKRK